MDSPAARKPYNYTGTDDSERDEVIFNYKAGSERRKVYYTFLKFADADDLLAMSTSWVATCNGSEGNLALGREKCAQYLNAGLATQKKGEVRPPEHFSRVGFFADIGSLNDHMERIFRDAPNQSQSLEANFLDKGCYVGVFLNPNWLQDEEVKAEDGLDFSSPRGIPTPRKRTPAIFQRASFGATIKKEDIAFCLPYCQKTRSLLTLAIYRNRWVNLGVSYGQYHRIVHRMIDDFIKQFQYQLPQSMQSALASFSNDNIKHNFFRVKTYSGIKINLIDLLKKLLELKEVADNCQVMIRARFNGRKNRHDVAMAKIHQEAIEDPKLTQFMLDLEDYVQAIHASAKQLNIRLEPDPKESDDAYSQYSHTLTAEFAKRHHDQAKLTVAAEVKMAPTPGKPSLN